MAGCQSLKAYAYLLLTAWQSITNNWHN